MNKRVSLGKFKSGLFAFLSLFTSTRGTNDLFAIRGKKHQMFIYDGQEQTVNNKHEDGRAAPNYGH